LSTCFLEIQTQVKKLNHIIDIEFVLENGYRLQVTENGLSLSNLTEDTLFTVSFNIGIAETNAQAKYEASSYRSITKSQELDEEACSRYLTSFTSVVNEDELGGVATFAATCFLNYFKNSIKFIQLIKLALQKQPLNLFEMSINREIFY
jgi:hypothetical protein